MPWFYCDDCGDSIKKPKVAAHCGQCSASGFTCIDCSRHFDRKTVQAHVRCVTEHEKYAQGATKPGGYASKGFFGDAAAESRDAPAAGSDPIDGLEFLSHRAPWKCTICNVNCTSQETLMGHAQGAKHKRRAKAALAARGDKHVVNGNGAAVPPPALEQGNVTTNGVDSVDETGISVANNSKSKDKKIKWRKIAAAELKKVGVPYTLTTKKLVAALLTATGVDASEAKVVKKLQKSEKFEFEGSTVRLRN